MRKRLFALLLAAVLVLSIGTAQATAGEMSGTEQTEQGADAPVPAPDAADAAGEDAPAGEPGEDDGTGENDALAGENGDPGEDDEFAGENGENNENGGTTEESGGNGGDGETAGKTGEDDGDDGETVPAADNSLPSNDEPQTTEDGPATVTVLFEGAEHITSMTADGADVLSDAQAGTPIVLSADSEGRVSLGMELEDGYTAGADENSYDSVRFDGGMVEIRDDGDGKAVVQITALPQVIANSASGFPVKVTLVDDEGYVTRVTDSSHVYTDGPLTNRSYELNQGAKLRLEAKVCALDVAGGHVTQKYYRLDQATGDLSVDYSVEPDGTGDMTVTTRPDDQAPTPILIEYEDPDNRIGDKDKYVLPGWSFSVEPKDDNNCTISVEGSVSCVITYKNGDGKECYMVHVNEDATSVKVTVMDAMTGATMELTGFPEAAEATDQYNLSGDVGRNYVGHKGTMADGKGWFMLKNGYAVGPGVKGGSVWLWMIESDGAPGGIYSCYIVDAAADTVTVPIVEAQPYRWVDVKVDNDVEGYCNVGNVLPPLGTKDNHSGSADWEAYFMVLDELTAEIGSGYELEAVSGCTMRWEKDEYGKLTYRVFPDAAGDTSVQLRVIEAGQQEPVLKVGTDADTDVQMDGKTESKLQDAISDAIDALAKGSVPAGMSQDTAEKLKAALEEADAVTVPELSAVLRVKKEADTAAFSGAVAVYEIEIVLSVNGQEVGSLTELAQPISISLPLPPETGRIVYLIRSHEGKQERLAATVKNGSISFATDQFSEFAIMSSSDLAEATVDPIPDQTWTGSALTPKVRVTIIGRNGEETLKEGADYELTYKDNVEAGTATVTIVGIGDFAGSSTTVTFRILEAKTETTTPPTDPGGTTGDPGGTTDDPGSTTDTPATGDETPLTLYTWLLVLSASGLAALLLQRKKQR